jgi:UDP-glucose 4-epimerase
MNDKNINTQQNSRRVRPVASNGMKILVTGGAGFIGSHLVDQLVKLNHQVIVVDDLSSGFRKFINPKAKFFKLSIKSPKLKTIFDRLRPQAVFHLAAQKSVSESVRNPLADAETNIIGSLNVIECSRRIKIKKFIFISTGGAIYGDLKKGAFKESDDENPVSPYALAKWTIDKYLKNFYQPVYNFPYVSLRLSNVYGPRQDPLGEAGVAAIFCSRLLKKKKCFINGRGNQTRDFVFVNDVVEACVKSLTKGHGVYNIGVSRETTINQLYSGISNLILGSSNKAIHRQAVPGEVKRSALNYTKAKKELNWIPKISTKEGLNKTLDYFRKL